MITIMIKIRNFKEKKKEKGIQPWPLLTFSFSSFSFSFSFSSSFRGLPTYLPNSSPFFLNLVLISLSLLLVEGDSDRIIGTPFFFRGAGWIWLYRILLDTTRPGASCQHQRSGSASPRLWWRPRRPSRPTMMAITPRRWSCTRSACWSWMPMCWRVSLMRRGKSSLRL